MRVPELRLTTHCTRKREDLSEALPTGMREVDETRLVLGRRVQRAGVANLPQQLWRKILHQAFMYLPGSISFRITASSSDYHIGQGISEYLRYISRAWWATRIQASMRGLLQRWRELKQLTRLTLIETKAPFRRLRGDVEVQIRRTVTNTTQYMQNTQRWRRRLHRQYGATVGDRVLESLLLLSL